MTQQLKKIHWIYINQNRAILSHIRWKEHDVEYTRSNIILFLNIHTYVCIHNKCTEEGLNGQRELNMPDFLKAVQNVHRRNKGRGGWSLGQGWQGLWRAAYSELSGHAINIYSEETLSRQGSLGDTTVLLTK